MLVWNVIWIVLAGTHGGEELNENMNNWMWLANSVIIMICEICNALTFVLK